MNVIERTSVLNTALKKKQQWSIYLCLFHEQRVRKYCTIKEYFLSLILIRKESV
jgi:hypothetical protein